jgi:uncharacterized protein YbjT (DUF2867 family)
MFRGKKLIAVMGATGMQGGALVDAILADGTFACRAITRNPSSEKALSLAARGCEVVEGDADKPDTLERAFQGADGAFLLTNFWEHKDFEREYRQATGAADAAVEAGVKHIVWSTLESVVQHDSFRNAIPKIGDVKVPHFDAKARATHYMKSKLYPVTYFHTSFYMENFYFFGMMSRVDDSQYEVVLPTTRNNAKIPMLSMHDLGIGALSAFKDPANYINQDFKVVSDMRTPTEIGAQLEKVCGVKVAVKEPTPLEYAQYGSQDLANMFLYFSEYQDVWATYSRVHNYDTFESCLQREAKVFKDYISKSNAGAIKQNL